MGSRFEANTATVLSVVGVGIKSVLIRFFTLFDSPIVPTKRNEISFAQAV